MAHCFWRALPIVILDTWIKYASAKIEGGRASYASPRFTALKVGFVSIRKFKGRTRGYVY